MPELSADPIIQDAVSRVAPGTDLREAIDMIIAAKIGALICIGDVANVERLSNGGFRIDAPFSSQKLFELAKMDGAILMDGEGKKIIAANLHLMPDPTIPSRETGMRHRTAEQVSKQTDTLVISISQRRDVVSLYRNGNRLFIESTELLLAKANQALQTLQNYRMRFDESMNRLTMLEFNDMVTVGYVTEAISRYEMLYRIQLEVERYIRRLGTDGRLVQMQLDEITHKAARTFFLLVRDYAKQDTEDAAKEILERFSEFTVEDLVKAEVIYGALGYSSNEDPTIEAAEEHISPRGYRVMSRIPTLSNPVMSRIINQFGSLPAISKASPDKLDDVSGISAKKAQAILKALENLRGGNL